MDELLYSHCWQPNHCLAKKYHLWWFYLLLMSKNLIVNTLNSLQHRLFLFHWDTLILPTICQKEVVPRPIDVWIWGKFVATSVPKYSKTLKSIPKFRKYWYICYFSLNLFDLSSSIMENPYSVGFCLVLASSSEIFNV